LRERYWRIIGVKAGPSRRVWEGAGGAVFPPAGREKESAKTGSGNGRGDFRREVFPRLLDIFIFHRHGDEAPLLHLPHTAL